MRKGHPGSWDKLACSFRDGLADPNRLAEDAGLCLDARDFGIFKNVKMESREYSRQSKSENFHHIEHMLVIHAHCNARAQCNCFDFVLCQSLRHRPPPKPWRRISRSDC